MLTLLRAALVAVTLLFAGTLPGAAQQAAPTPAPAPAPTQAPAPMQQQAFSLTAEQIGAIAVGAVAGAVLLDVMGGGGMVNLTGAVIGGFIGYWIYTQPAASARTSTAG